MSKVAITTIDNPFDPFDQFKDWFGFDSVQGYNTVDLLGRVANYSNSLPPAEQDLAVEDAIDSIVKLNPMYKKVKRD